MLYILKLLYSAICDESGGLGITRASLVSAIADKTGDDSSDAVTKIERLINEKGPDFCAITNFPFLRSDLNFTLGTTDYKFSGASYLPTTYKRVVASYLLDGDTKYPLDEVSIKEFYTQFPNPADNDGRPDKFCITRMESGYWEIAFDKTPDGAYVVYLEIELQWTDLTASTSETVITKPFFPAFAHFVSLNRFVQQGDSENLIIAQKEWWNPQNPKASILGRLLGLLGGPMRRKRAIVNMEMCGQEPSYRMPDYTDRG